MNIPQIRLESTPAKIEMSTQKSMLEIDQKSAELSIEQPAAEMEIDRKPSMLSIDQTKAREDMDLKHISKRIEEAAQLGYEDWLNGIGRVSQDGDELMMIENGGNPIAEQAKRNGESPTYEFNIGWIPSAGGVQINYDPGKLNIKWKVNKPIIEVKTNVPTVQYTAGKVNINMKQYASLRIDFEI
ncbi:MULTISPECIES: DUF6470 family protein [unclassified Bacillus (in: firmicutes)]|uniref:DUF6470 family protein n=1 Tax=unclassified Bacillus (in: firmicutes) TaxID=185979 RepID=UPI0008EA88C9|nr:MULTISPECIES: DUF6470 family protein [unclassified Bacillus (in: firmicutes)]SFB25302.1 hypothetical protein SAMN02799634_1148 [Bacillus sp. UNCCL13]SFQ91690.1 hypothetical protein SAMN04488577_0141 [Bacillus sp. cl95]